MRISLGDVSLWFDVSGPSVIPQGDTTAERPVVVAVHGGPGLDHMTVKPLVSLSAVRHGCESRRTSRCCPLPGRAVFDNSRHRLPGSTRLLTIEATSAM